jgi:hypothetical protein
MAAQRLIVAIGRIERALSRLEQMPLSLPSDGPSDLIEKHERLKAETRGVIADMDTILASMS